MLRCCFIALAALTGCAPTSGSSHSKLGSEEWSSLEIRLTRGMCEGVCPWYGVEIRGDGSVTYCGFAHVQEMGERTRKIAQADVRALADAFAEAKFADLDAEYLDGPTDGATYSVWLSFDNKTKQVLHYSGSDRGRALLETLEAAIDRTARVNAWIGEGEARLNMPNSIPSCARRFGIVLPEPMPPPPL